MLCLPPSQGHDLRDLKGLEALCDALPQLVRRLDIIINNACQTVRRPPQYYLPLLEAERVINPEEEERVHRWTKAHASLRVMMGEEHGAPSPQADNPPPAVEAVDVADGEALASAATAAGGASSEVVRGPRMAPGSDGGGSAQILPGMSLPVSAVGGQSAVMSQLAIVPGDETRDDAAFPKGKTDANSDLGGQYVPRVTVEPLEP